MQLDESQKLKAQVSAQGFIIEALLAFLFKLNPEKGIEGTLHEFVMRQIDSGIVDGGLNEEEKKLFKETTRHMAINLTARGVNASRS